MTSAEREKYARWLVFSADYIRRTGQRDALNGCWMADGIVAVAIGPDASREAVMEFVDKCRREAAAHQGERKDAAQTLGLSALNVE